MLDSEQLKIVNNKGETYILHPNYEEFGVLAVEGLSQPSVEVNISESGTSDGGKHNSSHIGVRDIVIHLIMFGWTEAERKKLYRMFPPKSAVELYYRNTQYNVHTTAHVRYLDVSSYYDRTKVRVELTCPDPYLHAADDITATASGAPLSCTITNDADCNIGFTAEITISTTDTPELVLAETQSASAEYLGDHTASWYPYGYAFDNIDLTTQTFNIYINGNLKVPDDDFSFDFLTRTDGHKMLWMESTTGGLANAKVTTEIITVSGKSITDMRYWESSEFTLTAYVAGGTVTFSGLPSWFDKDNDAIILAYTHGAVGRANVMDIEVLSQEPDGTYTVKFTYQETLTDKRGKFLIYGSASHIDVHDDVTYPITREASDGWYMTGSYAKWILSPTIPTYDDTKDIFRVYRGNTQLNINDLWFETLTHSDGTTEDGIWFSDGITDTIYFDVISSSHGDDIRDYTQQEIDDALCYVDNLTLTNATTGESMAFPHYQFENGDKIEICTVPGNIHATVKESTWLEPGTSLLADVFQTGTFFKLQGGDNLLRINADTNFSYVSATFSAERLYGGV